MSASIKSARSEIVLAVDTADDVAKSEVVEALAEAVQHETALAKARRDEYLQECQTFEARYELHSDEFLVKYASGELGDDADFVEWLFVKDAHDKWDRRYRILNAVSV